MLRRVDKVSVGVDSRELFYVRNLDLVINQVLEKHGYSLESYSTSLFKNIILKTIDFYSVMNGCVSLDMLNKLKDKMLEHYNSVYKLIDSNLDINTNKMDEDFLGDIYGDLPKNIDCLDRAMVVGAYVYRQLREKGIESPKVKKKSLVNSGVRGSNCI